MSQTGTRPTDQKQRISLVHYSLKGTRLFLVWKWKYRYTASMFDFPKPPVSYFVSGERCTLQKIGKLQEDGMILLSMTKTAHIACALFS